MSDAEGIYEAKYNDLVRKIVNAPPGNIVAGYKAYLLDGVTASTLATVHPLPPPARPGASVEAPSDDSAARAAHPATGVRRAPLRAVEPLQDSLLNHCPACGSGDPTTPLYAKTDHPDYRRKCTDQWHS